VNSENTLNEKNKILMKSLKNRCRACGDDISEKDLRCEHCRKLVDKELKQETHL
jgi:hypothetical protein